MTPGTFIAVVGPSGAGKDTLIDAALARRPDLIRARRIISRPEAPETEDFQSVTEHKFRALEASGGFALHWQAHGLFYGISTSVHQSLQQGSSVIANLSRSVLGEMMVRFSKSRVVNVTATPDVLATRLAARGRETETDIAARLARSTDAVPSTALVIDNSGSLEDGIAAFLAALPPPHPVKA